MYLQQWTILIFLSFTELTKTKNISILYQNIWKVEVSKTISFKSEKWMKKQ